MAVSMLMTFAPATSASGFEATASPLLRSAALLRASASLHQDLASVRSPASNTVEIRNVEVFVSVEERVAQVRVVYHLAPDFDGILALEALRFDRVRLEEVSVGPSGDSRPLEVETDSVSHSALVSATGQEGLRLTYRVALPPSEAEGDVLDLVLPLLTPARGRSAPSPEFFQAAFDLGSELRVVESFPTGVRPDADQAGRWTVSLPVLPAVLRLRASEGPRGAGLVWWTEVSGVLAVLALSWVGWTHLRRYV